MRLPFIKMQGLGNDYVYIDCFPAQTAELIAGLDVSALARRVSDRHFGVGSDGLVLIMPSKVADIRMRMFNADGSEAEMCGNASRCIGRYAYEHGLCGREMTLETLAGIKHITVNTRAEKVTSVTVRMGKELGNPHKVYITDTPVETIAIFEHKNTNAEWVNVLNRREIRMRVWERGTGETMACGTGACAAAMETMNKGLTDHSVRVFMPGGEVTVSRDEKGIISLTGSATEVFHGEYIEENEQ